MANQVLIENPAFNLALTLHSLFAFSFSFSFLMQTILIRHRPLNSPIIESEKYQRIGLINNSENKLRHQHTGTTILQNFETNLLLKSDVKAFFNQRFINCVKDTHSMEVFNLSGDDFQGQPVSISKYDKETGWTFKKETANIRNQLLNEDIDAVVVYQPTIWLHPRGNDGDFIEGSGLYTENRFGLKKSIVYNNYSPAIHYLHEPGLFVGSDLLEISLQSEINLSDDIKNLSEQDIITIQNAIEGLMEADADRMCRNLFPFYEG